MPFFSWNPSFSVGIQEMDSQHQTMIELLNTLHEAMRVGKGSQEMDKILAEMIEYANSHFAAEEKMLSEQNYPGYIKQKASHTAYLQKAKDLQNQFNSRKIGLSIETLNFLKDWWSGHIQGEDKMYGSFLQKKGLS